MAAPVGPAALVTEDALKFTLPTFLGLLLFVPFWNPRIDLGGLLLFALFIGFGATPLIGNRFLWLVGLVDPRQRRSRRMSKRGGERWNYGRTFAYASKDEIGAVDLADARSTFTLLSAAFFTAYFLTILVIALWQGFGAEAESLRERVIAIAQVPIPLVYDQYLPAIAGAVVSGVLAWQALAQYYRQQLSLFNVRYPELARKYHVEKGGIAQSAWGRVTVPGSSWREHVRALSAKQKEAEKQAPDKTDDKTKPAATARIKVGSGPDLGTADVDDDGEFTFKLPFDEKLHGAVTVTVSLGKHSWSATRTLTANSVPEFNVEVPVA